MPFPFAFWQGGYGSRGPDFMGVDYVDLRGGTEGTFTVRNPMATDMDIVWTPADLTHFNTIANTTGIKPNEIRQVTITKKAVSPVVGTTISWVWTSGVYTGTKDCNGSLSYYNVSNEPSA